jgi:protein O-mannosyl-transferase
MSRPRKKQLTPRERLFRANLTFLLSAGTLLIYFFGSAWFFKKSEPEPPRVQVTALPAEHQARIEEKTLQVQKNPRSGAAWGNLGMSLWAYDFRSEARVCFDRAEKLERSNPRWPYFLALASSAEDPEQSMAWLKRTIELCGRECISPRYQLAKILIEQGRWKEAETEIDTILGAKPGFAPVLLFRAQHAFSVGDLDAAVQLVRQCLDDPRTRKSASALLAAILHREGNSAAALDAAQQAAAAPQDEPVVDPYETEVSALRDNPQKLVENAHSLLAARKLGQAATVIDRLVQQHRDVPETWLALGRLCLLQNKLDEADAALRKHLELDPTSVQGLFQLGTVQLNQNRFELAAESFARAVELKPDFGPAWFNRAFSLGRSGKFAQAVEPFEQAIRHNPEHIESYLLLADIQLQMGNKQKAVDLLAKAELINPNDRRLPGLKKKAGLP